MKVQLNWHVPVELGSSNTLRGTMKNFDMKELPEITGIYIFYRVKRNGSQEALYVGQTKNIRMRMKSHFNSLKLVEGLENTVQGRKMLIFAEVKTKGDLSRALNQAEKGYIQHFMEHDHPLLNQKLMADHFDEVSSIGDNIIDLVSEEIYVYSIKSSK